jgi:hypothetical protein
MTRRYLADQFFDAARMVEVDAANERNHVRRERKRSTARIPAVSIQPIPTDSPLC